MASRVAMERGAQRRADMLVFIRAHIAKHGYSPSFREIGQAVGLSSRNAVRLHLLRLSDEGKIRIEPRLARAITLIGRADDE